MYIPNPLVALLIRTTSTLVSATCIASGDHNTFNNALTSVGKGAIVQLCPSATILISGTIFFTAEDQELSTQDYPTSDT
jgi:hypothetical protein